MFLIICVFYCRFKGEPTLMCCVLSRRINPCRRKVSLLFSFLRLHQIMHGWSPQVPLYDTSKGTSSAFFHSKSIKNKFSVNTETFCKVASVDDESIKILAHEFRNCSIKTLPLKDPLNSALSPSMFVQNIRNWVQIASMIEFCCHRRMTNVDIRFLWSKNFMALR